MKHLYLFIAFTFCFNFNSDAQTFSEDIAPIIYNNCTSCHRTGEIGPMPLTNYEEVKEWSSTIAYVTEIGYMPPWKPDKSYSTFLGEKGLSSTEIQAIQDWVANDTPQGDPANEPPLPFFPDGSQLGTPDLVLRMEEAYTIEGNNRDDYRVFVLPTHEEIDREIAAIEFRPGNTQVVHHALIAFDDTGQAAQLDAETPEYGYFSYGDFGVGIPRFNTGYTPGILTFPYPEGIGHILPAGADVLVQIHYAPVPNEQSDLSSVNIFFKEEEDPIEREVQMSMVLPGILDGGWSSFVIPPNEVKTFHGTLRTPNDVSVLQVYPHGHLLCKDWEIFAVTEESDTINLIKIPDWDFNWQGAYTFDYLQKIPAGSIIHIFASYDNTVNNPFNPNNPPQQVRWGEGTRDEMYFAAIMAIPYQEGDEYISTQTVLTSVREEDFADHPQLYNILPNPASGSIAINYYLPEYLNIEIALYDMNGTQLQTIAKEEKRMPGNHKQQVGISHLANGIYFVTMTTINGVISKKVIVNN